jgi:guanine deaminase
VIRRLIRGRLLSFHAEPQGPDDHGAFTHVEDGALILDGGLIEAMGEYRDLAARAGDAVLHDHRPHLILPGFVDPHIHFPQMQVIASWGAELLDWLNRYTFPEEARFADPAHAARIAAAFFDALARHGTTTPVAFCSVHPGSADAFFAEAEGRGIRALGGKVMMDRNAPESVRDTAQAAHDDSAALIARWHGRGRLGYAITPRFAVTSTPAQLDAAGALAAAHPDCPIQTHLAENHAEIATVARLFPDARDYTDVYARHGLLRGNTLLGHCLHLSERETAAIAQAGATPVFCPTSNLFLGSGLFDEARLRARGIRTAIATDVGGGTSLSMLATLAEAYKVLALQGQRLHPFRAFHWITRGNALALGMAGRIGTLDPGSEADLVVLDARATPEMALRMERAETLAEELFVLMIMGDDRAVAQTWIGGEPAKPAAPG